MLRRCRYEHSIHAERYQISSQTGQDEQKRRRHQGEEKQDIYDLSNIYCVDYENRILSYFNNEEDIQTVYEKGNAMELLVAIPDYYEPSIMDKMPQKLKNKYFKKEEIKEEE